MALLLCRALLRYKILNENRTYGSRNFESLATVTVGRSLSTIFLSERKNNRNLFVGEKTFFPLKQAKNAANLLSYYVGHCTFLLICSQMHLFLKHR